ncbi:hypothetical protein ASJ81_14735 [Methanosarcina spelaei]|uniref:Uncharacterized protein n=1 Tax=Methanosarcina spelaei TaxID=1036679 RepID=A0A2A2HY49_9EURY|nr:hypothetical protein ASJ81_14735 [Methanosarcina spelaei]
MSDSIRPVQPACFSSLSVFSVPYLFFQFLICFFSSLSVFSVPYLFFLSLICFLRPLLQV